MKKLLFLIYLLFLTSPAFAGTFVQQVASSDSTSSIAFPSMTLTAGNLVVIMSGSDTTPFTGISDTNGNTWTMSSDLGDGGGGHHIKFAYSWNVKVGSTTITLTGCGDNYGSTAMEYSGVQSSSDPIDGTPIGTYSTSANPTSGNLTTTADNDVLIGAFQDYSDTTVPTLQGSWVKRQEYASRYWSANDSLTNSTGTNSFTVTRAAHQAILAIIAFKSSSGGGGGGGSSNSSINILLGDDDP